MTALLYGSGLRLMECVRMRVKDIDFHYRFPETAAKTHIVSCKQKPILSPL